MSSEDQLASREAEVSFLGDLGASSTHNVGETLRTLESLSVDPEDFAFEDTRHVFSVQVAALRRGESCDLLSIEGELRRANSGGLAVLLSAAGKGVGVFESWAVGSRVRAMKDLRQRRKLRLVASELMERARNLQMEPEDAITFLSTHLNQLVGGSVALLQPLSSKMMLVSEQLDRVAKGESPVLRIGWEGWDRNVGGWWPTLNVFGGHPSRGKSGLVLAQMISLATGGLTDLLLTRPAKELVERFKPVTGTIFTMEDPAEWMIYRALAFFSRVPGFLLRTRELTVEQHEAVGKAWPIVEALAQFILFDERSRLKASQVVAGARDAILVKGSKYIVIDHKEELAVESQSGKDRHDLNVASSLADLRSIAKAHGVPVVLLSQLSRSTRPPHTMFDFKNASAVEETARMACIVWSKDGEPEKVTASVVKNTNGKRDFDIDLELDACSGLVFPRRAEVREQPPSQEALF